MNQSSEVIPVYELGFNFKVAWQGHSKSNKGNDGNRLFPKRQMLAGEEKADACSGDILKNEHWRNFFEHCRGSGLGLCPACQELDARRGAALVDREGYERMDIRTVLQCASCDVHGLLVTAKNAEQENEENRKRIAKGTIIHFAWALSPESSFSESPQTSTRSGSSDGAGQMLMKRWIRSGWYAFEVRYQPAAIGVDTYRWIPMIEDQEVRIARHRAVLLALLDQMLSPSGALNASAMPHLTGLMGAVTLRSTPGRAPIYSALDPIFMERLQKLSGDRWKVYQFNDINEFAGIMDFLIEKTIPYSFPKRG